MSKESEDLQNKSLDELLNELGRLSYYMGFIQGLTTYAWYKDGVQYVGSCGTTLKEALVEAKDAFYNVEIKHGNRKYG